MVSENEPQEEQEKKPKNEKSSESSVARAMRVIGNTEEVKNSTRQIIDGSLLGTCLVFIAAMLGLSGKQIDTPLNVALISFALAIPLLIIGFWLASYKPKPVQGWLVLEALLVFGWIVEALGGAAVAVGVFAVIAHLNSLAFTVSLWTAALALPAGIIFSLVGVLVYAAIQIKKEQKKQ
jgi:hypothetical protein